MRSNWVRAAGAIAAALIVIAPPARAQSIVAGGQTISVVSAKSETGGTTAQYEWSRRHVAKTNALLEWYRQYYGAASVTVDLSTAVTTTTKVRFAKPGAAVVADHDAVITIYKVVLSGGPTRKPNPNATAALMTVRYKAFDGGGYSRLDVRNGSTAIKEYSLRHNNLVTEMSARQGDCIVLSAVKLLEHYNPPAANAIKSILNANASEHIFTTLTKMYDVRQSPAGQRDLNLLSDILISSNLEEEFQAAYISGTLDQNFKPLATDSALTRLLKDALKQAIDEARKQVAKAIWSAIASWLGL